MAKMGRPLIKWNDKDFEQFESMCAIQCTATEIANITGVSIDTINRLVREKYDLSFTECFNKFSAKGKRSLRRNQFYMSEKSPAMAIFLGKQYLGQRDYIEQNITAASIIEQVAKEIFDNAIDEAGDGID